MDANKILSGAAEGIIDRASIRDDGNTKSMPRIVAIFNAITDQNLSVREGWLFMKSVKLGRGAQGGFHMDDWVDEAAYGALAGEEAYRETFPTRQRGSKVQAQSTGLGEKPHAETSIPLINCECEACVGMREMQEKGV